MTGQPASNFSAASTLHNIQLNTRVLRSQACRKWLASDQLPTIFGSYSAGWGGGLAILVLLGYVWELPDPPPSP
jgi:hypothetical protein